MAWKPKLISVLLQITKQDSSLFTPSMQNIQYCNTERLHRVTISCFNEFLILPCCGEDICSFSQSWHQFCYCLLHINQLASESKELATRFSQHVIFHHTRALHFAATRRQGTIMRFPRIIHIFTGVKMTFKNQAGAPDQWRNLASNGNCNAGL